MRIFALLTLLMHLAIAQYAPPPSPSSSCAIGSHRCDFNALQTCTLAGVWSTIKTCPSTSYCFAQNDSGACHPLLLDNAAQCSTSATHRCANNTLQACSEHGYWTTTKECTETAYCFAQTTAAGEGDCHSLLASGEAGQCATLNAMRCLDAANGTSIQACGKKGYWESVEKCLDSERCQVSDEEGRVECVPHGNIYVVESHDAWPWSSNINRTASMTTRVQPPTAVPQLCSTGATTCSDDSYRLLMCNANHDWETIKKCTTPGDCIVDSPGHAHCQRGGVDPPNDVRSTACKPNALACDKDRRFLFTCAADGTWPTSPLQCFAPGYCRAELGKALMCAGFPQYDGNNGKCKTHCESMDYLYCIGTNWKNPDYVRKCLKNMCSLADCKGCDRCNYKMPYGGKVVPDLTTVVDGKGSW